MPSTPASAPGQSPPVVVRFTGPRTVDVHEYEPEALAPGQVRVRTLYSGISAGTELTAFRGSNVYLNKRWDDQRRLFTAGTGTFSYPVTGWGYSEVGVVVEVAGDVDPARLAPGDRVYGIWGHRSEAVLTAAALDGRRLAPDIDPLVGVFGRVGAIALNAVASADLHLGEDVAVFGQGVLGLLTTRLATLSGTAVVAVDPLVSRLALAREFGARHVVDAGGDEVAEAVKLYASGTGVDVAIEISGSYRALHEAVRSVAVDGRVVAAGLYQGEAVDLHLGEEFHHNRVQVVASQIDGLPRGLAGRWNVKRLHRVFMGLVEDGQVDVHPLVSHVLPVRAVASAFALLDERPADALQVVLDFRDPTALAR